MENDTSLDKEENSVNTSENNERNSLKFLYVYYKNINLIIKAEQEKLYNCIEELEKENSIESAYLERLKEKQEELSIELDYLSHELEVLKKKLLKTGNLITAKLIQKMLRIQNPNESIFYLMKNFCLIINSIKSNKINPKLIDWSEIRDKTSRNLLLTFLSSLSSYTISILSLDCLRLSFPFIINYDRMQEIFIKFLPDSVNILNFVKICAEYNNKLNIFNRILEEKSKNENEIKATVSKVKRVNFLCNTCQAIAPDIAKNIDYIKEYNVIVKNQKDNYTEEDLNILNLNHKEKVYNILMKYSLLEKYKIQQSTIKSKKKYTIKLRKEFKENIKFLSFTAEGINKYLSDKDKNLSNCNITLSDFVNSIESNAKNRHKKLANNEKKGNKNSLNKRDNINNTSNLNEIINVDNLGSITYLLYNDGYDYRKSKLTNKSFDDIDRNSDISTERDYEEKRYDKTYDKNCELKIFEALNSDSKENISHNLMCNCRESQVNFIRGLKENLGKT